MHISLGVWVCVCVCVCVFSILNLSKLSEKLNRNECFGFNKKLLNYSLPR